MSDTPNSPGEPQENAPETVGETQDGTPENDASTTRRVLEAVSTPEGVRPTWTYFLTPIAVILGGALIAGAIFWTDDDDSSNTEAVAPVTTGGESTVPDTTGSAPSTLRGALDGYAMEIELDSTAFNECLVRDDAGTLINVQLNRGAELGVSGTPTFFINNKRIVGAQPPEIFQEVIDLELQDTPPTNVAEYSAAVQALASSDRFEILAAPVDVSDAVFEGDPQAEVIVAEFSDFGCPFCQRWNQDNLTWLRPMLGEDVALAFLHFPIQQLHPNAPYAAVASICAQEQGKFWEMHDILFARQTEWQSLPVQ